MERSQELQNYWKTEHKIYCRSTVNLVQRFLPLRDCLCGSVGQDKACRLSSRILVCQSGG